MVLTKKLTYEVFDLEGNIKPNSSISIELKQVEKGSKHLFHKAIVIQSALKRQGTVSCKTRSEVEGGGRKPWKQKGTGRARSGSSNSPLWRGGGVTFGPKPKKSNKKINIKEKQLALTTALCTNSNKITVVDNTFNNITKPNTKTFLNNIEKIIEINKESNTLIVMHESNANILLSARNIPNIEILYPKTLHLKAVLLAKTILITEEALSNLTKI